MELSLSFDHGLGDFANFAHILELYRRRGYRIGVHCFDRESVVFAPLGATRISGSHPGLQYVPFPEPQDPRPEIADRYWLYNKAAINVSLPPLPDIGPPEELWPELCAVRLDGSMCVSDHERRLVDEFLSPLPRPIVLIHSMGNTSPGEKNVPPETCFELYERLLEGMDGTLVLLDWDDRVPRIPHWRVRHMTDDWLRIDVPTLIALMQASDLFVSVDSGPLHLARMTDVPTVGLFPRITKYPCKAALPRARTVNVVPREPTHACNLKTRLLYNIVESPGHDLQAATIADVVLRMLSGPRYLDRDQIGADVQLQQFVLDWERGRPGDLSRYVDRNRGFDALFREIKERFPAPTIVETGCVRQEEDWNGAGYGTYLLGAFTHRGGGEVISVDLDAGHCEFARQATREMGSVTVVHQDSVSFLEGFGRPIDVLVLDSMDTNLPGHEEHALREAQAGSRWLHDDSIVVFDDTLYRARNFVGKGALAVPWLLGIGWRILHSGYQTILVRGQKEASIPCGS